VPQISKEKRREKEEKKGKEEGKKRLGTRSQRGDFECTIDETSPRGGGFIVIKS
jgi:hypothetical protein|tara:strand:- start:928 stop:1089 length:162 start_codon:yes stop_codon:yes gene_type:complete